jgi:hypothetical protein
MTLTIVIHNIYGEKHEYAKFEDSVACSCVAQTVKNMIDTENNNTHNIKSVTILDEHGQDKWQEVMG